MLLNGSPGPALSPGVFHTSCPLPLQLLPLSYCNKDPTDWPLLPRPNKCGSTWDSHSLSLQNLWNWSVLCNLINEAVPNFLKKKGAHRVSKVTQFNSVTLPATEVEKQGFRLCVCFCFFSIKAPEWDYTTLVSLVCSGALNFKCTEWTLAKFIPQLRTKSKSVSKSNLFYTSQGTNNATEKKNTWPIFKEIINEYFQMLFRRLSDTLIRPWYSNVIVPKR